MSKELITDPKQNDCIASVIIPCYNCAKYIEETLFSLECQSNRAFEVICVNDGSKDNTLEILEKWQQKSSLDIRIFSQENSGVSSARNQGIQLAKGKYILFLDGDDLYNHSFVSVMIELMETNKIDTAYCMLTRNIREIIKREKYTPNSEFFQDQTEMMEFLLKNMGKTGFCCYVYKKSIITDNRITFSAKTRHFEDREFNWKYLSHCSKGMQIPCELYGYRITENSATRQTSVVWRTDSLEAVKRVETYLKQYNPYMAQRVHDYLFPRVLLGMEKVYAGNQQYTFNKRLNKEYNAKKSLCGLFKYGKLQEKVAAFCCLISPRLLYLLIRLNELAMKVKSPKTSMGCE